MIPIQPGRFPTGEVHSGVNLAPASGQTFKKGRVLSRSGATVSAHALGTTVTGIFGVALSPADDGRAVGPDPRVVIARVDHATEFIGQLYDTDEIIEATMADHYGNQYGLIVVDGDTFVDAADTTNVVVEVVDVKPELNIVVFKFLPSTFAELAE